MTFMRSGADERLAVTAFWRAMYSEHGEGNVLLIWVDDSAVPDGVQAPKAIYADNIPLARMVTDRFSVHFPRLQGLGFEGMTPQQARFHQNSDSRWFYQASCIAGDTVIELDWRQMLDHQMLKQERLEHGGSLWDLYAVMCPCGEASITINGQAVVGDVQASTDGDRPASSTFIALSETWVKRDD